MRERCGKSENANKQLADKHMKTQKVLLTKRGETKYKQGMPQTKQNAGTKRNDRRLGVLNSSHLSQR